MIVRRHPRHPPARRHLRPRRRRRRGRARRRRSNFTRTRSRRSAPSARSLLFVRAYSLGGGTYTGIEAVSNGVQIMREPKVRTAKRTMVPHGDVARDHRRRHHPRVPARARDARPDDKTMNAVLLDRVAGGWHIGGWHVGLAGSCTIALASARRACSSSPRRPASSTGRASWPTWRSTRGCRTASRRCPSGSACRTACILMGGTSIAALLYTHGDVEKLVVMYSINVFLTFSLSNLGMTPVLDPEPQGARRLVQAPAGPPRRPRRSA